MRPTDCARFTLARARARDRAALPAPLLPAAPRPALFRALDLRRLAEPVVGWCSWFAFFDKVTDADVRRTADVSPKCCAPYGYESCRSTTATSGATGLPEMWLTPNAKFPEGSPRPRPTSGSKGLDAGHLDQRDVLADGVRRRAPGLFVQRRGGRRRPRQLDRSPGRRDGRRRARGARPADLQGAARHGLGVLQARRAAPPALRGLQRVPRPLREEELARRDVLRQYVAAVREEIGRDRFLLACWGVRPELAGLVDGCRIGTDGFSYAGLAQYNSFNNVVWRNDPDHIELSDSEAWRSTMVTSLTGSLFLLTDKPERYRTRVRRAAHAGGAGALRPSRASSTTSIPRARRAGRVDAEVSGRDPKPFDAGLTPAAHLYLLEVEPAFESWLCSGAPGGRSTQIRWEDLGLDAEEALRRVRVLGAAAAARRRRRWFAPGDLPPNVQLPGVRDPGAPGPPAGRRHEPAPHRRRCGPPGRVVEGRRARAAAAAWLAANPTRSS